MHYAPRLHIVLYHPEIPQNAGNIGRTCVAIGAKLWMVRPLGFEVTDYYLRRAGLDYWQLLEWEVVDDWPTLLERLPPGKRYCLTKRGARNYTDVRYQPGDALICGSESSGLPDEILAAAGDATVRIPMRDAVRSLNLSNAAAIVAYEALRQWGDAFPLD